ncbi:hypothetical protein [Sphingomonas sp. EC-HK361]|uniref:hypothetical protein n=1 Tax=Sphingomonas sp. EC-HK361 TaxID=2038397 RepID=UPI001260080B|nr:hypothetical protein [Sphingomonas sp. EC-HK361]
MRITRVFRSRWNALVWAGGVLWFAYDVANAQPQQPANTEAAAATDAAGSSVDNADLSVLANAMR